MKRILILAAVLASSAALAQTTPKPVEIWLTPERRAELSRVTQRPLILSQERIGDTLVTRWTNGLHGCVTTQRVVRVLGARSADRRQETLDRATARAVSAEAAATDATNRLASVRTKLDALKKKAPLLADAIDGITGEISKGR